MRGSLFLERHTNLQLGLWNNKTHILVRRVPSQIVSATSGAKFQHKRFFRHKTKLNKYLSITMSAKAYA